jgi:putative DNA primase/helicase
MTDSDPVAIIEAQPFAKRAAMALDDDFLDFVVSLDALSFERVRARLRGCQALSKAWDATVEAKRPKAQPKIRAEEDRWQEQLRRGDEGRPMATPMNAGLIVRNWPPFASLRLNELSLEAELDGKAWRDGDSFRWQERIEQAFDVSFGREVIDGAIEAVSEERGYHPIRERILATEWDRHERIKLMAAQTLDCHDPLAPRILECFMLGAVARIFSPGEKVDSIFTLYSGDQGRKKSTFFEVIAYDKAYIGPFDPSNKDHVMAAATSVLNVLDECDELTGRMEWPAIKRFASMRKDTFRPPYGRRPRSYPRGFVNVATTNKNDFLRDETGNRRWHILEIGKGDPDIRMATLEDQRDQLWAEAHHKRLAGIDPATGKHKAFLWWLTPSEEEARHEGAKAYEEKTVVDDKVSSYVLSRTDPDGDVRMVDVLMFALGVEPDKVASSQGLERRAGAVLRKMGFFSTEVNRVRAWRKR